MYTTILSNTISEKTVQYVPAAVQGLVPQSQIAGLMEAVGAGTYTKSFSTQVVAAVQGALTRATVTGLRVTALSSLAFGVVGIVACALCKDIQPKMTNKIEVYMENTEYADRNQYH